MNVKSKYSKTYTGGQRMDLDIIGQQVKEAIGFLIEESKVKTGEIIVIGCSTSEVIGKKIGTASSKEVAEVIFSQLIKGCQEKGIYLAIQCCEHLNRALVIEEAAATIYGLEEVLVTPIQRAGGSLAETAMGKFLEPIVVESIKAHAGMDIGDTFIGMHLKQVAVPIRSTVKEIGHAHLTMAGTRPKLIGGDRAVYNCT